jgi:hypothetical protein
MYNWKRGDRFWHDGWKQNGTLISEVNPDTCNALAKMDDGVGCRLCMCSELYQPERPVTMKVELTNKFQSAVVTIKGMYYDSKTPPELKAIHQEILKDYGVDID